MTRQAPVVVFDFDGTLVRRDSFTDFALRYCARRLGRLLFVGALLPAAGLCALWSFRTASSLLLWAMTLGTSTRRLALEMRRYARDVLPAYANEPVFQELERHVREGSRVVIATGTVPLMVRALLRARKLPSTSVVGSRLARRWGGLVAATHCIGGVKVRELGRRLGIVEWATVYTDSFVDRPLLTRSLAVTLVSPSARTLLRTRQSLAPSVRLRVVLARAS